MNCKNCNKIYNTNKCNTEYGTISIKNGEKQIIYCKDCVTNEMIKEMKCSICEKKLIEDIKSEEIKIEYFILEEAKYVKAEIISKEYQLDDIYEVSIIYKGMIEKIKSKNDIRCNNHKGKKLKEKNIEMEKNEIVMKEISHEISNEEIINYIIKKSEYSKNNLMTMNNLIMKNIITGNLKDDKIRKTLIENLHINASKKMSILKMSVDIIEEIMKRENIEDDNKGKYLCEIIRMISEIKTSKLSEQNDIIMKILKIMKEIENDNQMLKIMEELMTEKTETTLIKIMTEQTWNVEIHNVETQENVDVEIFEIELIKETSRKMLLKGMRKSSKILIEKYKEYANHCNQEHNGIFNAASLMTCENLSERDISEKDIYEMFVNGETKVDQLCYKIIINIGSSKKLKECIELIKRECDKDITNEIKHEIKNKLTNKKMLKYINNTENPEEIAYMMYILEEYKDLRIREERECAICYERKETYKYHCIQVCINCINKTRQNKIDEREELTDETLRKCLFCNSEK